MESDSIMYDSITGGALRMARRRWWVFVVAALLGALLSGMASSSAPAYQGERIVRFTDLDATSRLLGVGTVGVNTLTEAIRLRDDEDRIILPAGVSAAYRADFAARTLTITVLGDDEASVADGIETVVTYLREAVISDRVVHIDNAVAVIEANIEVAEQRLAEIDAALSAGDATEVVEQQLALDRSAEAARVTGLRLSVDRTVSLGEVIKSDLIDEGEMVIESTGGSTVKLVAGAILLAGLTGGVMLLLVAVDGRVRRRVHVERFISDAPVISVLPRTPSPSDVSALRAAVEHFASEAGVDKIELSGVGSVDISAVEELIGEPSGLQIGAAPSLSDRLGDEGAAIVLVFGFGRAHQDQLAAAIATARFGGTNVVGMVMTGVPRHDLSWARVSSDA